MSAGIISCITAAIGCFVLVFKWYTRTKSRIERIEEILNAQKEFFTKRGVEIAEKNTDAMEDSNDKLLSDIDAVLRVRKKNNTTQ